MLWIIFKLSSAAALTILQIFNGRLKRPRRKRIAGNNLPNHTPTRFGGFFIAQIPPAARSTAKICSIAIDFNMKHCYSSPIPQINAGYQQAGSVNKG